MEASQDHDLADAIAENAASAQSVTSQAGSQSSHSLESQIAADRYLASNRSRHETDNNPSLKGIVRTICDYEVGTGPTLHIDHDDEDFTTEVEQRWREWSAAANFTGKLRQMVYGRVVDGESFARIGLN